MVRWMVLLLLGGCLPKLCEPVGTAFVPSLTPTPCTDVLEREGARCSRLSVASVPDDPRACRLEVAVAQLPATGPSDGVPAVLLPGGPGQVVLHDARILEVVRPWRASRDLLLLDPRGGGLSRPALDCDTPALQRRFHRRPPTGLADYLGRCADELHRGGLDLDAFRSARLADDIDALLGALGAPDAHVVGGSYGSRWAQTLLQRHPERVASLLLDAPVPWSVGLYTQGGARYSEVVSLLFGQCLADEACRAMMPDPWATLEEALDAWEADPVAVPVGDREVPLSRPALLSLLHRFLKGTPLVPLAPALVTAAANRDVEVLAAALAVGTGDDGIVWLLHHAVQCADAWPFADPEVAAPQGDPRLALPDGAAGQAQACARLGVTPASAEVRQVPSTGVPALLTTGAFDPGLPPAWAHALAASWPNAQVHVDPAAGHGVLRTDCGKEVASRWLADPAAFAWPACAEHPAGARFVTDRGQVLDALRALARPEAPPTGAPSR